MKHFIVSLLVGFWLLGPHSFGAISARNGVSITTASTINGVTPNSAINGQTITGGGGGAWYYIQENTFNGADSNLSPTTIVWEDVTVPSGSATQLGIYITTVNFAGTIRLMLYNSGGTLLQNAVTTTISTTGWHDVAITPQAVTSGTHILAYIGQDNDALDVGQNTSSGTLYYEAGQSGTAPGTLPTPLGSATAKIGMRVWVE